SACSCTSLHLRRETTSGRSAGSRWRGLWPGGRRAAAPETPASPPSSSPVASAWQQKTSVSSLLLLCFGRCLWLPLATKPVLSSSGLAVSSLSMPPFSFPRRVDSLATRMPDLDDRRNSNVLEPLLSA